MKLSIPVKMLYLLTIAYAISLTETNLTGGGEQFLMMQGMNGTHDIQWLTIMMLIHLFLRCFLFLQVCREEVSFLPWLREDYWDKSSGWYWYNADG